MIFQTSRCSNPNNSELLQVKDTKIGRELKHYVYFTKITKIFFADISAFLGCEDSRKMTKIAMSQVALKMAAGWSQGLLLKHS